MAMNTAQMLKTRFMTCDDLYIQVLSRHVMCNHDMAAYVHARQHRQQNVEFTMKRQHVAYLVMIAGNSRRSQQREKGSKRIEMCNFEPVGVVLLRLCKIRGCLWRV